MLPTGLFNINKVAYLKSNSLSSLIRFTVLCLLKPLKAIVLIWVSCCRVPNFHPFPCFSWESPLGRQTAKKLCEGMEKGSVKAGNSEKSSYRYAILFFSLKLLLLLRTRLESSSYQKRKAKAKMCRKIWQNLGISGDFLPDLSNKKTGRAGNEKCHRQEKVIFLTYPCKFCRTSSF